MLRVSPLWRSLALAIATAFLSVEGMAQVTTLAQRIELCGSCHGRDGNSSVEKIPSLAGQPEFFILNQLFLMREGVRRTDVMASFVKTLSDAEMDALAKHYSRLPPHSSCEQIDLTLAARGEELSIALHCGSCHLPTLAGQDQMPRLAKQRIDYLIAALIALRDGKRSGADSLMSSVLFGLSDPDLTALAHYAGSR